MSGSRSNKPQWIGIGEDRPVEKGKMEIDRQRKLFDKWRLQLARLWKRQQALPHLVVSSPLGAGFIESPSVLP
jgi:hypothetical protein